MGERAEMSNEQTEQKQRGGRERKRGERVLHSQLFNPKYLVAHAVSVARLP